MRVSSIPFEQIPVLSAFDKMYQARNKKLEDLIQAWPSKEMLGKQIAIKQKQKIDRRILVDTLLEQHQKIQSPSTVFDQIKKLRNEGCFTVCTAHQLNLFAGPLYVIYKICTAIKLSREMSRELNLDIVPIFVMGSEDHDFEEINHCRVYQKHLQWEQSEQGAIGRFSNRGMDKVILQLEQIIGLENPRARQIIDLLNECSSKANYGQHVQYLLSRIFGPYGLVVLDMDTASLKNAFSSIMLEDAIQQHSYRLVSQTNILLKNSGLKVQANPRKINLFYHHSTGRKRLEMDEKAYKIQDTNTYFDKSQLKKSILQQPDRWSPNVLLRPLYQEFILPNICYIGGGGELAYWVQLKSLFSYYGVCYPILLRRQSVLWISKSEHKKMQQFGITTLDLFEKTAEQLSKKYVQSQTSVNTDEELAQIRSTIDTLAKKLEKIDKGLGHSTRAMGKNWTKDLKQLNNKIVKIEKHKHRQALQTIQNLKEKLFPNQGLQERTDNFIPYYLKYGEEFFSILIEEIKAFETDFLILTEEQ